MSHKPISAILICAFLLQILPATGFATPKSAPEAPNLELKNSDVPPVAEKDEAFGKRSQTASNFMFKEIPRDLGLSLKESFWGWGSLAFALGAGLTGALYPLDDDINDSLSEDEIFGSTTNTIVDYAFAPYTLGGVSILLWISGHASHHPKLALTGRALTESLFLTLAITYITKGIFRRTRPNGGSLSFPSAHTSAAFATAGVLTVFYGWKAAVPSYAIASLIGVSRIDNKSHFLTDVVMGAVIGSVVGIGTAKFHKKDKPQYFITPEIGREHAAIRFNYIF